MPSMSRSTSKVPMRVRQGWPPLTVPVMLISFLVPTAALNTAFWVPRETRNDVSTSCRSMHSTTTKAAHAGSQWADQVLIS